MNIRKPVDYRAMYQSLDQIMAAELPQVKLYFEIGRAVSTRPEKGAAVMAAEYLQENYPSPPGTCAGCGSFTVPMLIVRSYGAWPWAWDGRRMWSFWRQILRR